MRLVVAIMAYAYALGTLPLPCRPYPPPVIGRLKGSSVSTLGGPR